MQYRSNPALETIKPDWPGNPFVDGKFAYLKDDFFPEWRTVWRMLTTPNPQAAEKKADQWRPAVSSSTDWMQDRERNFLIWLGHATFVIQLGGVRYITDPVLGGMPFVPRLAEPAFPTETLRGIDYILISHDHRDHCDKRSLKTILQNNRPRKILAPLAMDRTIGRWIGETPLEMAGWYQVFDTPSPEARITFLPTRHWSRRGLWDFNKVLWGAFMFEFKGQRYYFGSDSSMHWHYEETGRLYDRIDIAMLGIGAYAPDFMMQDVHTNPEEAVSAWQQLGARYLLPMHHGTFDLSNEPISEPQRRVRQRMQALDAEDRLILPAINEVVYLDEV